MDTIDIGDILRADDYAAPLFRGVMALDEFQKRYGDDGYYVVNTAVSSSSGEHWLMVRKRGARVDFFDSYGNHPSMFGGVYATIRGDETRLVYNDRALQGPTTTVCGDYCTLLCLTMSRGWSMERFARTLGSVSDSERRDHAVRRFMLRNYDVDLTSADYDAVLAGVDGTHVAFSGYDDEELSDGSIG